MRSQKETYLCLVFSVLG